MTSSPTVVVITGANSGIGYATAQVIASSSPDYHIFVAGRNPEKVTAAVESIRSDTITKSTLSPLVLDVTSEASIAAAARVVEEKHGHVDVFINNAGISSKAPTLREQLETTFATNVIGAALVSEAFTPLLLKSKSPRLIHISSSLGSFAYSSNKKDFSYGLDYRAYRMSKAALDMLALQDFKGLGEKGVRVWAVDPGLVESGLRGEGEANRTMGGKAGKASVSGETILSLVEGKRDADVGKMVHKDGVWDW